MKHIINFLLIVILFLISCDKSKDKYKETNHELILINEIFTHENTGEEDKKMGFSAFQLPENVPSDWEAPVNYKDGEVHFRVSILTKPDKRIIYYQMGFQWDGGCNGRSFKEKFPDNRLMKISEPGIYNASQFVDTFWEPSCQESDPIDWTKRMTRLLVVVWDENFHQIDDRWGFGSNIENIDGYYPMDVHFQAIIVPFGESFSGWQNYSITIP
jgi:hypothetical protein